MTNGENRVALLVGDFSERDLIAAITRHGDIIVASVTTAQELLALIDARSIDIAVMGWSIAPLTGVLIGACDAASVRLIVLTETGLDAGADGDAADAAAAVDFHEVCPADTPWPQMLALLHPSHLVHRDIPPAAFFDIVATPLPPLPPILPLAAPSMASVIAVWGPAGAPGRTTVAVNVAAELAISGHRVLLVDADSYGGAIAPRLGLLDETPGFAAACRLADHDLLTRYEIERLSQRADVGKSTMAVLTGILRPDRWPELSATRVAGVVATCREFFDAIVVDVGFNLESDEEISSDLFSPRRNAATLSVLSEADTVVAVSDSSVVGLARFLRASAELREMLPETPLIPVANRVRSRTAGIAPRAQVRQTLERFGGLRDIVLLPHDDRSLDECELRAQSLCDVAPNSAVRHALLDVTKRCLPTTKESPQSMSQEKPGSRSMPFARRRG